MHSLYKYLNVKVDRKKVETELCTIGNKMTARQEVFECVRIKTVFCLSILFLSLCLSPSLQLLLHRYSLKYTCSFKLSFQKIYISFSFCSSVFFLLIYIFCCILFCHFFHVWSSVPFQTFC